MVSAAVGVVALLAAFVLLVSVAGWFASERILRVTGEPFALRLKILSVEGDTVTLPATPETGRPGVYGISWSEGHAIVGDILSGDGVSVTRRVVESTGPLASKLDVRWNVFVYQGDPLASHGLAYQDMIVRGELGPMPAWFLPGRRSTWALFVHGLAATREEGLRIVPLLSRLGYPVLVLTYRNDLGAPQSPDRYYHLGDREWKDLESAVLAAAARGAGDVLLVGWSMGGCIIETFLHRSPAATRVRAVVLDSPILDWPASIDAQVRRLHMPGWFTKVLIWYVSWKAELDLRTLNHVRHLPTRTVPTLLFHGAEDLLVPISTSDTFARSRQDLITYERVEGAGHTESWNADPAAYERALRAFLSGTSEAVDDVGGVAGSEEPSGAGG